MLQILKNKSKKIASVLAAGVLFFSQFAVVPTVGATDSNQPSYWCSNYDGGVKFDTGAVGTHVQNVTGGSISITIVDPNKTEVSNITGTDVTVTKAVIKGGSSGGNGGNGNQVYTPPFSYNLKAPNNNGGQQADISHVIVCYNKKTTVEVIKKLVPHTDTGKFELYVNNSKKADNVGHNGTTGKVDIDSSDDLTVKETAESGTSLANYTTSVVCKDDNGNGDVIGSASPSGDSSRQLTIDDDDIHRGDKIVCTFTNTRKTGNVKVVKDVVNDNGGTKTYADFTFKVSGSDTPRSFDATTSPDGEKIVSLPGGTSFTITEVEANTNGYVTSYSGTCAGTIVEGQTQVCTITNNDTGAKLRVIKDITNNNGGTASANDFTLKVNDQAKTQNQYFNANPGTYTVTETGPSGYVQTGITCVNDDNQQTVSHPVNLALGQSITCTVYNDDVAPGLTVIKKVINDNGGTKTAGDFTMHVNGTNVSDDSFPGDENGTNITLNPGTYTVTETGPSGYAASFSADCTGTIALGETKTCTVTNNDIAPILTIIKYVVNDDGGLLDIADFYLYVDNTQVTSGVANLFNAGDYTVSEINQPGYEAGDWGGDCAADGTITLALGNNKTCTVTNNDKPAKITVTKEVVNDDGGDAIVSDFTLKVNDTTVQSGDTNTFAGNAEYTISEIGLAGYQQTNLTCYEYVRDTKTYVSNPFTAELGHSYYCVIVNDDVAAKLKIKKEANPQSDHEFEFESNQLGYFQLDDDGDNSNSLKNYKQFEDLAPGIYSVREQETNDWYLESIVCQGTDNYWIDWDENRLYVELKAGDDITCKFVNEQLSTIKGHKFEDSNFNGEWDKGEPALAGWTIKLDCDDDEDYCDATSAKTNVDGEYEFEELLPGEYTVCEVQQAGWVQSYPWWNDGCYEIEIEGPGELIEEKNFGNFATGSVTGVKFNDINGNHLRDASEPTLKNWEITLTKHCAVEDVQALLRVNDCEEEQYVTTTGADGSYSFTDLLPGSYTVCETQKATWVQTYPQTTNGCHEFEISESGQVVVADFGNKAKPQVLGAALLVNTGVDASKHLLVGLTILSVLGALHFLSSRRKDYAR